MKHDSFRSVYLLRVCLCVRVPLRVGGYVYVRLCVYVCVRVCVCMGASVCVCACACVCTCVRVCVSTELPSHAGCPKSVVLKHVISTSPESCPVSKVPYLQKETCMSQQKSFIYQK